MNENRDIRIAIVYPGDSETRRAAAADNNRFSQLFRALTDMGVQAEPAVYHPDLWEEVHRQLLLVDGVLVWVNPIQDGHDRTRLDAMLRDISDAGIFVSAHPDIILKMGTKEIVYRTRHMGWGSDTHLYQSFQQLQQELPRRLAVGEARVLKQNRGQSGYGVWKVEAIGQPDPDDPVISIPLRVRHAARGEIDRIMSLADFLRLCEPFFGHAGKVLDQVYQPRLPEGMIRCYLVHDRVAGFGHQAINALFPTPDGAAPEDVPQPGPRLYHPANVPDFQPLKHKLEQEWVPELQALLAISAEQLPVIWDADFLLGPKDGTDDTYVLCEVNVSSVAPYPDSATPVIARAALTRTLISKARR